MKAVSIQNLIMDMDIFIKQKKDLNAILFLCMVGKRCLKMLLIMQKMLLKKYVAGHNLCFLNNDKKERNEKRI